MGLGIYTAPLETQEIATSDGLGVLSITLDGLTGQAISRRLYVRNDNLERYYTGIAIATVQESGDDFIGGTGDRSWKLSEGNEEPPNEGWIRIASGNSISFSDEVGTSSRGDISTYLPFWVRVSIPANQKRQNLTSIKLRLTAQEKLVV